MQYNMTCIRLPHSEISGSKLVLSYPKLIAEFYVLHRLQMSRHPLSVPLCTFLCIDLTSNWCSITNRMIHNESMPPILISYVVIKLLIDKFRRKKYWRNRNYLVVVCFSRTDFLAIYHTMLRGSYLICIRFLLNFNWTVLILSHFRRRCKTFFEKSFKITHFFAF